MGSAPSHVNNVSDEDTPTSISSSILATYKLLPTFEYCERLECYVDDLSSVSKRIPTPQAPPTKKSEVFDLTRYSDVDERALRTPATYLRRSLRELVDHLIEGYTTDLSKIRVIYRWITCQPIDRLFATKIERPKQQHAGFQLWRIKNKKGNYAQLVSLLCRYADIPCIIIHGTLKGSTYEVGDKIDEDVHYGEWNAVLIDKHWRFINAYWGTCSEAPELQPAIENHMDEDYGDVTGRLCYQCDENYFLTDPDQMVATHLPAISKWQLKKHPISFREFEEMTFVKDRYFNLRLKILSHPKCLVRSDTGEVELRFGIPRKSSLNLDFQYLLFKVDEKNHTEKRCDHYVFIHRTNNQETLSIKIRTPVPCTYRFELVGRDCTVRDEGHEYDWIAIYKIVFSNGQHGCLPYPKAPRIGWGPGRAAMSKGLAPLSHFTGEVLMDDFGKAEIKFGAANKGRIGDMTYFAMLYTGGDKAEELTDQVVHRVENGDVIINVMTPYNGEYVLKLFAKREDERGHGKEICNYFLISKQREENGHFPRGFTEKLGPKFPQFTQSGLVPAIPTGYIRTDQDHVALAFTRTEDIELSLNFSSEMIRPAEAPRLLSQEEEGDIVKYLLRMPEPGQYGVRLRGTRLDGAIHESLYDYIIDFKRPPKKRTKKEPTIKQEAETFDSTEVSEVLNIEPVCEDISPTPAILKHDDLVTIQEETEIDDNLVEDEVAKAESALDILRRRVRMAIEESDTEELMSAIAEMKTIKLPTVAIDVTAAQRELDILQCRRELTNALTERDVGKLKSTLKKTKAAGFEERMLNEFRAAKTLCDRLKKLQKLLHAVLNLDQSTIAEIRGYNSPPEGIDQVMKACLLVLGFWGEETYKWKNIQKILGGTGRDAIKKMIAQRNIDKIGLDVALGAKALLKDLRIEQVRCKSAGAATFYVWVCGVIDEVEKRAGDDIHGVRPRTCKSKRRQRKRERSFINPPKLRKENTYVEKFEWL